MSAPIPILAQKNFEIPAEADPSEVLRKVIPIKPDPDRYDDSFYYALTADNNDELATTIPVSDEEFLDFFARALAKEFKSVSTSEMASHAWLKLQTNATRLFGAEPASGTFYKTHGLNAIKGVDKSGEERRAFLLQFARDSILVLFESYHALTHGHPLQEFLKAKPTTLFLYYRQKAGIPIYVGHIFVQDTLFRGSPRTFFVSIYRSLFDDTKGFAKRVLADVAKYAEEKDNVGMFTVPLPGMKKTLSEEGFVETEHGFYLKDFGSATGGSGTGDGSATGGSGTAGGRRVRGRRKTRRRTRR